MDERLRTILESTNPWWRKGDATIPHLKTYHRHAFRRLVRKVLETTGGKLRGTILVGMRQVGKTELAKQIAAEALRQRLPRHQLAMVQVDDLRITSSLTMADILEAWNPYRVAGQDALLIIDEVQKLSDPSGTRSWARQLKGAVDIQEMRILATGSSAVLIREGGAEGIGRWDTDMLETLSFREFREIRLPETKVPRPENLFADLDAYLSLGGFPELAASTDLSLSLERIREYVDRALAADVPARKHPRLLRGLLRILMDESGEELNTLRLSRELGCHRKTIEVWIGAMETALLIQRVPRRAASVRREILAQPKIYASDPALAAAFGPTADPLSDPRLKSRLYEAAVLRHLRELAARSGGKVACAQRKAPSGKSLGEVDFLLLAGREAYLMEATTSSSQAKEKAWSVLEEGKEMKGKFKAIYGCVVHGGAGREQHAVNCVPLGVFLDEVLGGPIDDPCAPLRNLSTKLKQ